MGRAVYSVPTENGGFMECVPVSLEKCGTAECRTIRKRNEISLKPLRLELGALIIPAEKCPERIELNQ